MTDCAMTGTGTSMRRASVTSRSFAGQPVWKAHPALRGIIDLAFSDSDGPGDFDAAFVCADLELVPQIRDDHAPYIASWLKVLKNDKRAIFSAAAHAQRPHRRPAATLEHRGLCEQAL